MARKTKAGNGQAERSSATRERLLDVAERLFARRGLDAVSVRDITQAAGANLGAITYHFGTMRKLIVAVFDRRMAPLTRQRLEALDAMEKAAGEGSVAAGGGAGGDVSPGGDGGDGPGNAPGWCSAN